MKLFAFSLLTLICLNGNSQLEKKIWLVGGNGKFYSYNSSYNSGSYNTEGSFTQIDISPNVGYFIIDKLALGLRPTFSSTKGKITSSSGAYTNTQRYWIGPFCRYYFMKKEKSLNILTDISYQYGFFGGITKGKLETFSLLLGPVVYFNSSVGAEFLLGYSSYFENVDEVVKQKRKGFQLAIGFQIHLQK